MHISPFCSVFFLLWELYSVTNLKSYSRTKTCNYPSGKGRQQYGDLCPWQSLHKLLNYGLSLSLFFALYQIVLHETFCLFWFFLSTEVYFGSVRWKTSERLMRLPKPKSPAFAPVRITVSFNRLLTWKFSRHISAFISFPALTWKEAVLCR